MMKILHRKFKNELISRGKLRSCKFFEARKDSIYVRYYIVLVNSPSVKRKPQFGELHTKLQFPQNQMDQVMAHQH
jgi:hypothetical protein